MEVMYLLELRLTRLCRSTCYAYVRIYTPISTLCDILRYRCQKGHSFIPSRKKATYPSINHTREATVSMLSDHIRTEHEGIKPHLDAILTTAHAVGEVPRPILMDMVTGVFDFLVRELLPHAEQEDAAIYTAVEKAIGVDGSTNSMKREHAGIRQYVNELIDLQGAIIANSDREDETIRSLRRVLYGLHAIISLHLTVEEDVYLPLLDSLPIEVQHHFIEELKSNHH